MLNTTMAHKTKELSIWEYLQTLKEQARTDLTLPKPEPRSN